MKEFAALKLKLLRWAGLRFGQDRNAKVITRLAIPYNPSEPEPYEDDHLKGCLTLKRDPGWRREFYFLQQYPWETAGCSKQSVTKLETKLTNNSNG
jgi:hypothetical protein